MIWQYFGINIGNNLNFPAGSGYSESSIENDCKYLVGLGINYFRVAVPEYDASATTFTQLKFVTQTLLDLGVNVQYGVGYFDRDLSKKAGFEAVLATEAAWAQSVGVHRFQIGNEEEINGSGGGATMSEADVYTYMQTLPSIVSGAGFTGPITASVSQDHFSEWTSAGKGNFTDVGLDVYGATSSTFGIMTLSNFISQINTFKTALGSDGFISEWANSYGGGGDVNQINPELYSRNMMDRLQFLKDNFTRPCYLHCWRFNGTNVQDFWAAKKDSGLLRLFWYDITGQRRPIYQ